MTTTQTDFVIISSMSNYSKILQSTLENLDSFLSTLEWKKKTVAHDKLDLHLNHNQIVQMQTGNIFNQGEIPLPQPGENSDI